ncbi:peptide chain release factor N(5)-glutamine methyltransferase [Promicromonospora iranensis]|uniref:Release factor glutamine methyltransferase n=1 Tax=Promicromonospora iranensis TaxID=1105144 RepID=A0ABU2CS28_9MICO|nr:peptide chain release factor N(5)-glutamine methyltransferase [Promicromonospora iranensis]MDR7384145.1 release factor glutamine methyltransferase [Promicromonospora iranensis]
MSTRLLKWAHEELADAGVASPQADAEVLLAHALGVDRGELRRLVVLGREVPDDVAGVFSGLVARRAAREPLQHLTGVAAFRHLELAVGPGVFVPRPETEEVAQVAIDEAAKVVGERESAVVVDLCTGTGAIALAVATEVPGTRVHAVELDKDAHAWAERNVDAVSAAAAGTEVGAAGDGTPERVVRLVKGDARTALYGIDGLADVVVSNPPYVPSDAVPVDPEVAEHDPAVALYGLGPDGLEVPRGITAAAARLLRPGGLYVMEHAEVQAEAARDMVAAARDADGRPAFGEPETRKDLTGRPRMVLARRLGPARNAGHGR